MTDIVENEGRVDRVHVAGAVSPSQRTMLGLRGLAAILVVLYHCYLATVGGALWQFVGIVRHGYLSVDLFFIISGYSIAQKYFGRFLKGIVRGELIEYGLARVSRIYPAYIAWLAMSVLTWLMLNRSEIDAWEVSSSVLMHSMMLQSIIGSSILFNIPMWSVAVEVVAYLLFPIAAKTVEKYRIKAYIAIIVVFICTTIYLSIGTIDRINGVESIFRCLSGFSVGVAISGLKKLELGDRLYGVAQAASVAASAAFVWFGLEALAVATFAATVYLLTVETQRSSIPVVVLRSRVVQWLGDISYSLYLCHVVVLALCMPVITKIASLAGLSQAAVGPILLSLVLPGALLIASLSRLVIERPLLKWMRSLTWARVDAG